MFVFLCITMYIGTYKYEQITLSFCSKELSVKNMLLILTRFLKCILVFALNIYNLFSKNGCLVQIILLKILYEEFELLKFVYARLHFFGSKIQ